MDHKIEKKTPFLYILVLTLPMWVGVVAGQDIGSGGSIVYLVCLRIGIGVAGILPTCANSMLVPNVCCSITHGGSMVVIISNVT